MHLSDFDYNLPEDLIAQTPIEPRDHSRLLILDKNWNIIENKFFEIEISPKTGFSQIISK